jgi:hypothetical protein
MVDRSKSRRACVVLLHCFGDTNEFAGRKQTPGDPPRVQLVGPGWANQSLYYYYKKATHQTELYLVYKNIKRVVLGEINPNPSFEINC